MQWTFVGGLAAVVSLWLAVVPSAALAAEADHCAPGQAPRYVFGFADLKAQLGPAMGDPLTCGFADPNGTGDVHQQTTRGLAFWRQRTNTPTFTDGYRHWGHTAAGWVSWVGPSVDPPGVASSAASSQTVSSGAPDDVAYWRTTLRTLSGAGLSSTEQPVTSFPRPLRLPRRDAPLTAGLTPSAAWVASSGDAASGGVTYSVVLGPSPAEGNVTFWGSSGRARWAQDQKPPEGCERFTGSYCPYTFYAQGRPITERFTDLAVGSLPAIATHGTCCNGERWSIEWYDAAAEVTCGMDFSLGPAQALGADGLSPSHVEQARRLASMASELVSVDLG